MKVEIKQAVAWTVLPLSVLVVLIGKSRVGDLVGIVVAFFALLFIGADFANRKLRGARDRREARERANTPWTVYSRPSLTSTKHWEVGIRRVTRTGLELNVDEPTVLLASDELSIMVAEGEAKAKAHRWTEARILMGAA